MMHVCVHILLIVWYFVQTDFLELDENILPKEIQKIICNEYLFQLHLDEYNLKYGKENYTVSKILEMKFHVSKMTHVKFKNIK